MALEENWLAAHCSVCHCTLPNLCSALGLTWLKANLKNDPGLGKNNWLTFLFIFLWNLQFVTFDCSRAITARAWPVHTALYMALGSTGCVYVEWLKLAQQWGRGRTAFPTKAVRTYIERKSGALLQQAASWYRCVFTSFVVVRACVRRRRARCSRSSHTNETFGNIETAPPWTTYSSVVGASTLLLLHTL